MALHPEFPESPYAPLIPSQRWFPADETLRSTSYDKLLPPLVAKIRDQVHAWRQTGKTIEAGLVIAQSRAEGAQRVLLIVPKSLIGQWQNELLNLFGIQAQETQANFTAPGVYLVGREFAGSERGAEQLGAAATFDLVVIDEAHEIFAGLHKRYDRDGIYDETSEDTLMAHRVRGFLRSAPVLLLTATPMQNSLAELWGLVQYVEPTGTLLGEASHSLPCSATDRVQESNRRPSASGDGLT